MGESGMKAVADVFGEIKKECCLAIREPRLSAEMLELAIKRVLGLVIQGTKALSWCSAEVFRFEDVRPGQVLIVNGVCDPSTLNYFFRLRPDLEGKILIVINRGDDFDLKVMPREEVERLRDSLNKLAAHTAQLGCAGEEDK